MVGLIMLMRSEKLDINIIFNIGLPLIPIKTINKFPLSPKNQKPPTLSHQGFILINLAVTYSHMGISHTTIGITAFHFWVRYGIRWVHRIIAAKNRSMIFFSFSLISFFLFLCLLQTKTSWLATFSSLSFLLTVTLTHHARLGFPQNTWALYG